jgi:glucosamine 6-phosphate synthetase-like amidotransferase/phosphosugar isomerase protein
MCGLAGFIGKSKQPYVSFELFSNLFVNTQVRGVDAAGIYAVDSKNNITFLKDGVPSEVLINYDDYIDLQNKDINLLLGHCRQTSIGVGGSEENINNHPFVSDNNNIAVIHNGRIDQEEYNKLAKVYNPTGKCDSEVILRHVEKNVTKSSENNADLILESLTHFVGLCPASQYAIALGEVKEHDRVLYLLRNVHRSLWFFDLTKQLNQIFFASTDEILFTSLLSVLPKLINIDEIKLYKIEPDCIVKILMKENTLDIFSYKLKLHQKILLDYMR